jgi:protein involved in polysaccharide export with SLBB domain
MTGFARRLRDAAVLVPLAALAACSSTPETAPSSAPASVQVSGAVRTPGRVALPAGPNPLSLADAIATCGGFTDDADPSLIRVTRNSSTGRIQVKVSYDDIVGGRRPDFRLRADDAIFVPRRGR